MNYKFNGKPIVYREYGAGAEILSENGEVIADFKCHLDAEKFLDMTLLAELFDYNVTDNVTDVISKLTDEERLDIMRSFCNGCGRVMLSSLDHCHCWNDE